MADRRHPIKVVIREGVELDPGQRRLLDEHLGPLDWELYTVPHDGFSKDASMLGRDPAVVIHSSLPGLDHLIRRYCDCAVYRFVCHGEVTDGQLNLPLEGAGWELVRVRRTSEEGGE